MVESSVGLISKVPRHKILIFIHLLLALIRIPLWNFTIYLITHELDIIRAFIYINNDIYNNST